MKKKMTRKTICVLLCLFWLATLLPMTIFAESVSFVGTVGSAETFWIHTDYDTVVTEASIDNGDVPPGMNLAFPNPASVTLTGTPTRSGNYTAYVSVYTDTGDWLQYTVHVDIQEAPTQPTEKPNLKPEVRPSAQAPVVTKHPTGETVIAGESAMFIARADNATEYVWEIAIADGVLDCGKLPGYIGGGVRVSGETSETLTLSNIPEGLDDAYVRCRFTGPGGTVYSEYARIRVIAQKDATPVVTKDPTDETVDEGGMAVFVADAKYAQTYRWQLISPGEVVYDCATASTHFPELKVSGGDSSRLTLENIPAELDGYRIRCEFTAGSVVFSKTATLHVNPKPTEATTEPTTEPTTEATTEPTTEPSTEAPTTAATEAPEEPAAPQKNREGGVPWWAVAILLVLAGGGGAAAALVVMKKKQFEEEEETDF